VLKNEVCQYVSPRNKDLKSRRNFFREKNWEDHLALIFWAMIFL